MAVQNNNYSWGPPKGHLKIKEDLELELPWETFLREFFEEFSIVYQTGDIRIKLTKDNIIDYITSYQDIYFECHVDNQPNSNDRMRLIGLSFIRINEKNLQFDLADNKENQVIEKNQVYKTFDFFLF